MDSAPAVSCRKPAYAELFPSRHNSLQPHRHILLPTRFFQHIRQERNTYYYRKIPYYTWKLLKLPSGNIQNHTREAVSTCFLVKALKSVDLPTLGSPTIPTCIRLNSKLKSFVIRIFLRDRDSDPGSRLQRPLSYH